MTTRTPSWSTLFPSGQARQGYGHYWGQYASIATLPNGAGNVLTANAFTLEVGDVAWVLGSGQCVCTSAGTAGGGDAVWSLTPIGPSGGGVTTDKAIVRWNGTTGTAIQNGVAIETDLGAIQAGSGTLGAPSFSFVANPNSGFYNNAGQIRWSVGGVFVGTLSASGIILNGNNFGFTQASSGNTTSVSGAITTQASTSVAFGNGGSQFTGGAGISQIGVQLSHTINQTPASTAAFTSLDIIRVETVLGTGAQYLINAKAGAAGTTQVFAVTNAGQVLATGPVGTPALSFVATPTAGFFPITASTLGVALSGAQYYTISTSAITYFSGALTLLASNAAVTGAAGTIGAISLGAAAAYTGANVAQLNTSISSTLNQTGTAAFTLLDLVRTETATGSGAQLFINAKAGAAGTTPMFQVTNQGGYQVAVVSPAALAAGNTDDYAGTAGYSFARISTNAAGSVLRGILAPVPALGRRLTLINIGGVGTLTINNQDAGSAAANRIQTTTGAATILAVNATMELIYDVTSAFWRQV